MEVKRALISAANKELISSFAIELEKLGIEIYSTRGTSSFLKKLGVNSLLIEDYTGFPEILGGRVKTLSPKIFGGILARRELDSHQKEMKQHGIVPFDIVCVDLYPVGKVISEGADIDTVIENIDIGGISLIRAAAKAFKDVTVVIEPEDQPRVIEELKSKGNTSLDTRKHLAFKAFRYSSSYDSSIQRYLSSSTDEGIELEHHLTLRYGENPHQSAEYFKINNVETYIKEIIKGDISYNNLLDMDGAAELCFGLKRVGYRYAAVIVKHGSPSGVGVSDINILDAFSKAWDVDPLSSYGGVLALSEEADSKILDNMKGKFIELISAPSYSADFIEKASGRKKLKALILNESRVLDATRKQYRNACGGLLVQSKDTWWQDFNDKGIFNTVSGRKPTPEELKAIKLSWAVATITKSNSIVIADPDRILGIGGGCVSRIDATNMAMEKAKKFLDKKPSALVMASDGFFPFSDSITAAAGLGVTAVVEPGGSIRDDEVCEACTKNNIALVFTGKRHFRH